MALSDPGLIFVISQPRSGSTLLQHILGSHSRVATLPEPWLLLAPVIQSRAGGLQADYEADFARQALQEFLGRIDRGRQVHLRAIREYALRHYSAAAGTKAGAGYFLDKTPRYYHIIPEIREIFPDARVVLITRNPVAVLTSILSYNYGNNIAAMLYQTHRWHDLMTAPRLIHEAAGGQRLADGLVRYEALVTEPEAEVRALCELLGLEFEPGMLEYGDKLRFEDTSFVDTKSAYAHPHAVPDYVRAWTTMLDSPHRAALALAYVQSLGADVLATFGQEAPALEDEIRAAGAGIDPKLVRIYTQALCEGFASLSLRQEFAARGDGWLRGWIRVARHAVRSRAH